MVVPDSAPARGCVAEIGLWPASTAERRTLLSHPHFGNLGFAYDCPLVQPGWPHRTLGRGVPEIRFGLRS